MLPETQQFLTTQEKSRCNCLDKHGKTFTKEMIKGVEYIKKLPDSYNLDSLSIAEFYAIKLELTDAMTMIKILTSCVNENAQQIDQFTGMLIQEDLRVVLQIDSTMTEQQKFEKMNTPGLELTEEFCPNHKEAMLKFYELIRVSSVLPEGLK